MQPAYIALVLLAALVLVAACGQAIRRRLPEHHLASESKDSVKLAMGLVATMTALLLGLLVSSAKGSFDAERNQVIQMAAKTQFLDRVLHLYGPEAADARARFHETIHQMMRRMWPPDDAMPATMEANEAAGDAFYVALQELKPHDDMHAALKVQANSAATDLGQLRMLLMAQSVKSVSTPLLIMVVSWLLLLFFSFSVLAPPNHTTTAALCAAAVSVASALFLILEFDEPLSGIINLPSTPLEQAVRHFAT